MPPCLAERRRASRRAYYLKNKEKILSQGKSFREANQEKISARKKEWEAKNPQKERLAKYYQQNKQAIAVKMKLYRQENKEKNNERSRARYKNDIGYRLVITLRNRVGDILKTKKNIRNIDLLGCSMNHLKEHLQSKFKKGMTWDNYGNWHIDHIIPCASFDLTSENHQRRCFHYTNLQPLWAKENLSKKDKLPAIHQFALL